MLFYTKCVFSIILFTIVRMYLQYTAVYVCGNSAKAISHIKNELCNIYIIHIYVVTCYVAI